MRIFKGAKCSHNRTDRIRETESGSYLTREFRGRFINSDVALDNNRDRKLSLIDNRSNEFRCETDIPVSQLIGSNVSIPNSVVQEEPIRESEDINKEIQREIERDGKGTERLTSKQIMTTLEEIYTLPEITDILRHEYISFT
jgi:hypothetical protein